MTTNPAYHFAYASDKINVISDGGIQQVQRKINPYQSPPFYGPPKKRAGIPQDDTNAYDNRDLIQVFAGSPIKFTTSPTGLGSGTNKLSSAPTAQQSRGLIGDEAPTSFSGSVSNGMTRSGF
jgi:hypothetical protein